MKRFNLLLLLLAAGAFSNANGGFSPPLPPVEGVKVSIPEGKTEEEKAIIREFQKTLRTSNPLQPHYDVLQKEFADSLHKAEQSKEPLLPVWLTFMQAGVLDRHSINIGKVHELIKIGSPEISEGEHTITVVFPIPSLSGLPEVHPSDPLDFHDVQLAPHRVWRLTMTFNEDEILKEVQLDTLLVANPAQK